MFLRLKQHIDEVNYPASRVFRPGTTYQFPYQFVIPKRLPLKSCSHESKHTSIQQAHTETPPTLHLGNLSQSLCKIKYIIRADVSRQNSDLSQNVQTLASCTKTLHFVPTHEKGVSFSRLEQRDVYRSIIVQEVKSQWKRQTLGRLEILASTLQPIQVPSPCFPIHAVNTHVALQLRFDSFRDTLPPRFAKIHPTLKQSTLFSTKPQDDYLCINNIIADQITRGAHIQVRSLPSQTISSIEWTKHMLPHHSASSSFDQSSQPSSVAELGSSPNSTTGYYYTASVMIPISLSSSRDLVPTFHSCLVSRTYALELRLSYRVLNAPVLQRMITLEVPVKVVGARTLNKISDTLPSYSSITPDEPSHFASPPMTYYIEGKSWNTEYPGTVLQESKWLSSPEGRQACILPTYDEVVTRSAKPQ